MTKFPKREKVKVDHPDCECGYEWFNHYTSILHLFNWLKGGQAFDGKCKICECPFYKKDKEKEFTDND